MQGRQGWRRSLVAAAAALALVSGGIVGAGAALATPGPADVAAGTVGGASRLKISTQPKARTVAAGKTATFTVKVPRGAKVTWQVRKPGSKKYVTIKGATRTKLSVRATTKLDGARYRAKVVKGKARATSSSAKLTVVTKPKFRTSPAAVTTAYGRTASFTVAASGGSVTYTWYRKRAGSTKYAKVGTGTKLSVKATASLDGARYRAVARNAAGSTTSRSVLLRTGPAPRITTQPRITVVDAGADAVFSVAAAGDGLSYTWQTLEVGSTAWRTTATGTSASLTVPAVGVARSGLSVRVLVKNRFASVTSEEVGVLVRPTSTDPGSPALPYAIGNLLALWLDKAEIVDLGTEYPAPGAGFEYEAAAFMAFDLDEAPVAASSLTFGHTGADGTAYEVVEVIDIFEALSEALGEDAVDNEAGMVLLMPVVKVPVGAHGGLWSVTSTAGATPSTAYFDLC